MLKPDDSACDTDSPETDRKFPGVLEGFSTPIRASGLTAQNRTLDCQQVRAVLFHEFCLSKSCRGSSSL